MPQFLDQLKYYRKAYYEDKGKFPKPDRNGMVWLYPWALERNYYRYINKYMTSLSDYYHGWLQDNYERFVTEAGTRKDSKRNDSWYAELDSWNDELRDLQATNPEYQKAAMITYLTTLGMAVDEFNEAQFTKFAKQALNSELIPDEALTTPLIEAWAQQNHVLITSLSDEYIKKANLLVSDGVQSGMLYRDLTDELQKLDKSLTKNRARLIARDQIGKLNGNLAQERMESAGLSMYTWMTSRDERVRGNPSGKYPKAIPSHYVMDKKLCRWDDPTVWSLDKGKTWVARDAKAPSAHPGQEPQCRCVSIPYWAEIVAQIDGEIIAELN